MNITITCAILDDDQAAIVLLVKYVANERSVVRKETFDHPLEAKDYLLENEVDVLIADIQLPHMNAFELVNLLPVKPLVILCTGTHNLGYALRGYRISVVDYLSKPFSHQHFLEALQKVYRQLQVQDNAEENITGHTFLSYDGGSIKIYYCDIIYLEAVRNYVNIYLMSNEVVTVRYTLQQLEDDFPTAYFLRIHKSYMVSKRLIAKYSFSNVKLYRLAKELPLGRKYKPSLKAYMQGRTP